ncbi:MAG: sugar transferase [Mycoplasmatota bacterium]|nr:sugar transferase [Mycoplasmatota bacterium]
MYQKYIKRLLDIILSLIAIIITLPIFLITGILVLIFLGKPAIFRQKRPGKNEKIFTMYKFRTMSNKKDKDGNLLPDELRLTKLGKVLRKTSLDEIPEFINILKGDMSFVGPRPLLVEYLPYYTEEEQHRHNVRPGLTGLAQVSGRNLLDWDDRFKKDIEYINNLTFKNDLKIILKTFIKVIKSENIEIPSESHDLNKVRKERRV